MAPETTLSAGAGDDIESSCLKCKCVTNHTIIAMTGSKIAKVECHSCSGRHNYRPPTPEKKKRATTLRRRNGTVTVSGGKATTARKRTPATKKATAKVLNFERLLRGRKASSAVPYAINANLKNDDLLSHSVFGLGVVTQTILPNKAEVIFQEHGQKILICIPSD